MREVDTIIIGQGIAGTTLAWQLRWKRQRVVIIDRDADSTASDVAAGLISPITGRRQAVSWRFEQLWPIAQRFYHRAEQQTRTSFFHCQPMLKTLAVGDPALHSPFARRRLRLDPPFASNVEAIELAPAARLDVRAYLLASREVFREDDCYLASDIDVRADLEFDGTNACIPRLGLCARMLVFCQGIDANENEWFPDIQFEPTKGEILTVAHSDLRCKHIIHDQVWLAPHGEGKWMVGATYERHFENAAPTHSGRNELLQKLSRFLPQQPKIIEHRAAIRPTVRGRLPVIGRHPSKPMAFFNGLGSKGALRAPFVAGQLADFLVEGKHVANQLWNDPARRPNRPLTDVAQHHVSSALEEGDVAIDATVGNGFDTQFLATSVGEAGVVFGIDRQQEALDRTRSRLAARSLAGVRLILGSHARMSTLIPEDHHGRVAAIMFNLGYLPRGDKSITTQPDSTVVAISQGARLLRRGGIMTIVAYTGHSGGSQEAAAVREHLRQLCGKEFEVTFPNTLIREGVPQLYVVRKCT